MDAMAAEGDAMPTDVAEQVLDYYGKRRAAKVQRQMDALAEKAEAAKKRDAERTAAVGNAIGKTWTPPTDG